MRQWIYDNLNKSIIETIIEKRLGENISIEDFLNPTLRDEKLLDTQKAVQIIKENLLQNKNIVIYGDYDCDGASSVAVLIKALRLLSENPSTITYYTNNRFVDGYGMCEKGIDKLHKNGCDLIVTVDNGIAALEAVEYAKSLGMQVVVTDHHEESIKGLPKACAVVDPKRKDDSYPFKGICGAGVAWKIMKEIVKEKEFNTKENIKYVDELLDIVAMATIGDVVPLLDENRYIVKKGITKIKRKKPSLFFETIREVTGVSAGSIDAQSIAFQFVPVINAASRLIGDPALAIDCLIEEKDKEKIKEKMLKLKKVNDTRKEITKEKMKVIDRSLDTSKNIIVVSAPNIGEGIVGLIAGKIKEKYNKPTIVFSENGDKMTGSARSIPGFNIKESFDRVSSFILKYGGHEMAAGLTVEKDQYKNFKKEIEKIGKEEVSKEMMKKKYVIDDVLEEHEVGFDLVGVLRKLEPYGQGFPPPLFKVKINIEKVMYMGGDKDANGKTILDFDKVKHVKLKTRKFDVIIWNEAKRFYELGEPKQLQCLGVPSVNTFGGKVNVQFVIDNDNFIKS